MNVAHALPFEDSRRLLGANVFFASAGAVLEVTGVSVDEPLISGWQIRVHRAVLRLGWPERQVVSRRHAGGVSLAVAAPYDQVLLATEVNEWAVCATLTEGDPARWSALEALLVAAAGESLDDTLLSPELDNPPVIDESAALARFDRLSTLESRPKLRALLDAAASRELPYVIDDTELTLGAGVGGRNFSLTSLPDEPDVCWRELRGVPTAIVTGSNGKTTTVRLLAACTRAHGWHTGYNCTDGVFFDDEQLAAGDYSGPAGARRVMRETRAQAAIVETARGGILRRGIAVSRADVAVVTNVSSDHFGEYGIHDLEGLADVKLAVAAVVAPVGLLVLNADDALLRMRAARLGTRFGRTPALGWFSSDTDSPTLRDYRLSGAATCGVLAGRLRLWHADAEHDLGAISAMPLSMGTLATYNIANMAAAALAAAALGIPATIIAEVLARFGSDLNDNPGRLMRFEVDKVTVLVDYAHNPDGLRGLLHVADGLRRNGRDAGQLPSGRLALLLGQAGNRKNADLDAVARVAAEFLPNLIVVKENETQLRGRAPGEVPRIICAELQRLGIPDSAVVRAASEIDAALHALAWALPGDVLALPLHSSSARDAVVALLQKRRSAGL